MSRIHRCDVPGCSRMRPRYQRLCDGCYRALPHNLRLAVVQAYRVGRTPQWRDACKQAARFLADKAHAADRRADPTPFVTAAQAYRNHQRLLGEQD